MMFAREPLTFSGGIPREGMIVYELVTARRRGSPWKSPKNRNRLSKFVAVAAEERKD